MSALRRNLTASLAAVLLGGLLVVATSATPSPSASATATATYTHTLTVPGSVAGSFNFSASSNVDAWSVQPAGDRVFMLPHCAASYCGTAMGFKLQCLQRSTGLTCPGFPLAITTPGKTLAVNTKANGFFDAASNRYYGFAIREDGTVTSDTGVSEVGLQCVDVVELSPRGCGFTSLGAGSGVSPSSHSAFAAFDAAIHIGKRWYLPGLVKSDLTAVRFYCYDTTTKAACAGSPFLLPASFTASSLGYTTAGFGGSEYTTGGKLFYDLGGNFYCLDTSTNTACAGWNTAAPGKSKTIAVAQRSLFPILNASGATTGICVTAVSSACFNLDGSDLGSVPAGVPNIATLTYGQDPVVVGTRVFLANFLPDKVYCTDFATGSGVSCSGYPTSASAGTWQGAYSFTIDPSNPTCIWQTSDRGPARVLAYDAVTGGACEETGVPLPLSSFVQPDATCAPSALGTLTVMSPVPSAYTGSTVAFTDASGNGVGIADQQLTNGALDLSGLGINLANPLPRMRITLTGASDQAIQARMTWTANDASTCVAGGQVKRSKTGPPSVPLSLKVNARNGSITATWADSADDGGSAITHYLVTISDAKGKKVGSCDVTAKPFTCSVGDGGLSTTAAYKVSVLAQNANGKGPAATAANLVPAMAFTNVAGVQKMVVAVGDTGTIFRSRDGGTTYGLDTSGTSANLTGVMCPLADRCVAVGSSGTILHWSGPLGAGAQTWTAATTPGTSANLNSVACLPKSPTCLAVGASGTILVSDSADDVWTKVTGIVNVQLNQVVCPSATTCLAIGNSGYIYKLNAPFTTATNLAATPVNFNNLTSMRCPNPKFCIAVGDAGKLVAASAPFDNSSKASTWTTIVIAPGQDIAGIACPALTKVCVAVGTSGLFASTVKSSKVSVKSWKITKVSFSYDLLKVRCNSETVCVAVSANHLNVGNYDAKKKAWLLTQSY